MVYRRPPREFRRHDRADDAADAEVTLRLPYRPPYDWRHLQQFVARRALSGVEHVAADSYARTARTATGTAILQVRPLPAADALELRIRGCEPRDLLAMCSSVRRMFDLTADPAKVLAALGSDARLRPLLARRSGLRIPGTWDAFESGVRAIVGQQVSVRAGRTILERVVQRCGERVGGGNPEGLTHVFPTPGALATAHLDDIGLTRQRVGTLQRFARAVQTGAVSFSESSERVVTALTGIEGIGAWTAGYVALRGLSDPDAFPAGDLVLRRQVAVAGRRSSPQELAAIAESWRPFRAYAALHLWQADASA